MVDVGIDKEVVGLVQGGIPCLRCGVEKSMKSTGGRNRQGKRFEVAVIAEQRVWEVVQTEIRTDN